MIEYLCDWPKSVDVNDEKTASTKCRTKLQYKGEKSVENIP
jgi:hypothetical protein